MRLYIDPGTGSMLFAILIGVFSAALYGLRAGVMKLRFLLSGGKKVEGHEDKIPLVIFADDKRYWPVFRPVCRELDRRGLDMVYMTASPDDPALASGLPHLKAEFIGEGNRAFAKLNFLKANLVLSTTPGLDVYQWKRSKDVDFYVHMLHSSAEVTGYRMFGLDYYDGLLLSGQYQIDDTRALEALRELPAKETELIGIPYMDDMAERLAKDGPLPSRERTVLLAPSWGPSSIFNKFGGAILDTLLETGCHVIVRPHPQSFTSEKELMNRLQSQYPNSDRLEWNRDTDNYEVLRRADLMISDFSGVIFDFALVHDKPVIYADTEFDKGPYDAWWLDTPFWTLAALPRIGRKLTRENLGQLPDMIEACISDPQYEAGRKEVRRETWVYPGEGARRAADYLERKLRALTTKEGAEK